MPRERKQAGLSGAESSEPILRFLATAGSSAPSDPRGGVLVQFCLEANKPEPL